MRRQTGKWCGWHRYRSLTLISVRVGLSPAPGALDDTGQVVEVRRPAKLRTNALRACNRRRLIAAAPGILFDDEWLTRHGTRRLDHLAHGVALAAAHIINP